MLLHVHQNQNVRLTAVVLQHLLGDHGEPVSARHHVGRQHHHVDLLPPDRLVERDPAARAEHGEAFHAVVRRAGEVELHAEPCRDTRSRRRL